MSERLDRVLEQRRRQIGGPQKARSFAASLTLHATLTVAFFVLPRLLAETPPPIEAIQVVVVPPALLGAETPPPPPTETPPPREEPPPPKSAPPPPEAEDVAVIPREEPKKPKPRQTPPPSQTPPPRATTPPPSQDPPKREGSPFGSPFGAASSRARVGVEDPDFTYGYYLDRVAATISSNWIRPPIAGVESGVLYFRIARDGSVSLLSVRETSGSREFDDAALRAVEASSPMPPLPVGYKKDWIGVNLRVR